MSIIKLNENSFKPIPEGTHVFQIEAVTYKEDFGKLEIKMRTADNKTHTERFSLLRADGTPNDGAYGAFSYFARVAMNDFDLEEIDPDALVGHCIECEVTHDIQPSRNDPSKTVTFVRLGDKHPVEGLPDWAKPAASADFDLDDLLMN